MSVRQVRGITLIELLVAMTIASMVAATAYAVLRAVVRGAEAVEVTARERTVGRAAIDRLRGEVAGAVALRSPARPGGAPDDTAESRASISLLTVGADGLPTEVAYAFEGDSLVRWARPRDAAEEAAGVPVPGVEGVAFRFGRGGTWSDDWTDTSLPEAAAVRMTVGGRPYVTVIPVAAGG